MSVCRFSCVSLTSAFCNLRKYSPSLQWNHVPKKPKHSGTFAVPCSPFSSLQNMLTLFSPESHSKGKAMGPKPVSPMPPFPQQLFMIGSCKLKVIMKREAARINDSRLVLLYGVRYLGNGRGNEKALRYLPNETGGRKSGQSYTSSSPAISEVHWKGSTPTQPHPVVSIWELKRVRKRSLHLFQGGQPSLTSSRMHGTLLPSKFMTFNESGNTSSLVKEYAGVCLHSTWQGDGSYRDCPPLSPLVHENTCQFYHIW